MRSYPVGHIPQPIAAQIPMIIDLPAIAYERRQPSAVVSLLILSVPLQAALGSSGCSQFHAIKIFDSGNVSGRKNAGHGECFPYA